MSRIELDTTDRGSVDRARELLAAARTDTDTTYERLAESLAERLGHAMAAVDILLGVIDQTDR